MNSIKNSELLWENIAFGYHSETIEVYERCLEIYFCFNFEMQEYQDVTVFIEFITTIKERRGWYFYDHNFHEDIYTKILL